MIQEQIALSKLIVILAYDRKSPQTNHKDFLENLDLCSNLQKKKKLAFFYY